MSSRGRLIRKGFLKKKSPKGLRSWQKRYFVLYENVLTYGKTEDETKVQGAIPLREIARVEPHEKGQEKFQIHILNRVFELMAASGKDAQNWMTEIRKATDRAQKKLSGNKHSNLLKSAKFWKNADEVMEELIPEAGSENYHRPSTAFTTIDPRLVKKESYEMSQDAGDFDQPLESQSFTLTTGTLKRRLVKDADRKASLNTYAETTDFETDTGSEYSVQNIVISTPAGAAEAPVKRVSRLQHPANRNSIPTHQDEADHALYSQFDVRNELASGRHGKLYEAINQETNSKVMMQVVKRADEAFETGVEIIRGFEGLTNPYIMKQLYRGTTPDRLWAVYTYATNGSLFDYLKQMRRFPEDVTLHYSCQLVLAISHLHTKGRIVRNLDPERILLDEKGNCMIADFSISHGSPDDPTPCKTPEFQTPEFLTNSFGESPVSDWWRLGILMYELAVGFPPFRAKGDVTISDAITAYNLRFPPFCSEPFQAIVRALLSVDPTTRLGCQGGQQVMNHPFFQQVQWGDYSRGTVPPPEALSSLLPHYQMPTSNAQQITAHLKEDTISKFIIVLKMGRNLPPMDAVGASNCYVTLEYSGTMYTSKTIHGQHEPIWEEEFEFSHGIGTNPIQLHLWHALGGDETPDASMGALELLDEKQTICSTESQWYPVLTSSGTERGQLEIGFKIPRESVFKTFMRRVTGSAERHSVSGTKKGIRRRPTIVAQVKNQMRALVSKDKIRFQQDGFDLDLTYITERIIAMGFPAESIQGLYRNPMSEVKRFFDTYHRDHYKLYNLCAERSYDESKFDGRVERYPFEDHNACPLRLILECCTDIHQFLATDNENIVSIHCKAGKGRSGLIVSSYLVFAEICQTADQALSMFGNLRTANGKGVTIPSQRRYVSYFEQYLRYYHRTGVPFPWEGTPLSLNSIKFSQAPSFKAMGGCDAVAKIFSPEGRVVYNSQRTNDVQSLKGADCVMPLNVVIGGDFKLVIYHKSTTGKKPILACWLNTSLIDADEPLVLEKTQLDKAIKNKRNIDSNFKITIEFEEAEHVTTNIALEDDSGDEGDEEEPTRLGLDLSNTSTTSISSN